MAVNLAAASVVAELGRQAQLEVIAEARAVIRRSPLVRTSTPGGQPMRVRVTAAGSLGWTGKGGYRYAPADSRGKPWPPLPRSWATIATRVAGEHPWDSAIVNWYAADAALGWHRDLAEADHTLPIVTVSLGDAASWAMRLDLDEPVHRVRLESGAVTLLEGRTRLAYHSIERVIASPLLSPLRARGRLSITIRCAGGQR